MISPHCQVSIACTATRGQKEKEKEKKRGREVEAEGGKDMHKWYEQQIIPERRRA